MAESLPFLTNEEVTAYVAEQFGLARDTQEARDNADAQLETMLRNGVITLEDVESLILNAFAEFTGRFA